MRKFESLYRHDGWSIGLMPGPASVLLGAAPAIEWLALDGRAGFAADPFLIRENGRLYCFFEALPYATDRGKICYADITAPRSGPVRVYDAIVAPFHLSYPYLLRHEGEIVCVPEAGTSGRITAYAARAFPDGWTEKQTLIDGFAGVDSTIFRHAGRWWLFAGDAAADWNSALHIWYADTLFGRWKPHARNPVRRGLRGTRPAGRPFEHAGRLYRPAQDCSLRYGGSLTINEILILSPDEFQEQIVNAIGPDPGGAFPDGLHTANACDGVIAVDGNRLHFQPYQAARAIGRAVRKRVAWGRAG